MKPPCDYLVAGGDEDESRDYGKCKRKADWRVVDIQTGKVLEYLCTQHKQRLESFGFVDCKLERIK